MLSKEEALLYRNLYAVICDQTIADLLSQYATKQFNTAVRNLRSKRDAYDNGYANGVADAWEHIINLKPKIMEIVKGLS